MPYSSNSELPKAVRDRYSDHCQSVFRHTWNSEYSAHGDESRAFATAHASAKRCQGSKSMDPSESLFKIFVPMLKATDTGDGRMRLRGVASSTVKDRHGDVITLSALQEMEASARNLTIFLNHKYDIPEDVAGSVEHAEIRRSAEDVHDLIFDIVVNDENPRAEKAWRAIQKGTQLGLSIGARIPPGGATRDKETGRYTIEHVDLLETSLVSVPANPRSWVEYAVKSLHDEEPEEITKAPLSSEARNNLPDSAFACPGKRKYPHHTASGAVDKAHLRNALARCGDSSNDQCGCAHIRAHAKALGMGEAGEKSFEDLVIFALETGVEVEHFTNAEAIEGELDELEEAALGELEKAKRPAGHTHPHAHEHEHEHNHSSGIVHAHEHAHTHSHEHNDDHEHVDDKQGWEHDHFHDGSWDADHAHEEDESRKDGVTIVEGEALIEHLAGDAPTPDSSQAPQQSEPENEAASAVMQAALASLEPTAIASLRNASDLLKAVTRELTDTRESLVAAERERDQAVALSAKALQDTARLMKRLAETPLGRRTAVLDVTTEFAGLEAVYGEEFVALLKKKD